MRPTPGRKTAVALGIPVLLVGIGGGALNVTGALARSSENHAATYPWHGGTLTLNSGSGEIRVQRGGSASTIGVAYTEHYGLERPKVTGQASASGVVLSANCPASIFDNYCGVSYTVTVPAGVALKLVTGDGAVSLDGVDGPIDIHSGDGSIRGTDLRSTVLTADSGDGPVDLQWAVAPSRLDLSTGDGSVSLSVPNGSGPYAIDKNSGDGSSSITVMQDPAASRTIRLRTGDGDVSVH